MIVYLDASALVKRYVAEAGSAEVVELIGQAEAVGTAVISRAEVAAALAKASRIQVLARDDAVSVLKVFNSDWESLVRLQMTEGLVSRAASLAWDYGLRGYDTVHLASALSWQDMLGAAITVASYDRQLWQAVKANGLTAWPESLP
jgi:predicted nucleic acid-binding protein